LRGVNCAKSFHSNYDCGGVYSLVSFGNMSSISSPLPRSVRRVVEVMHANVGHRQSVAQLAQVAGVSARTLQRQFMGFLGKSPHAIWQEIGLERARQALLQGVPGEKVRDVAWRCGFPHFGRFSAEYRRRYGEAPSSTLKRQARFAAEFASKPTILVPSRDQPTMALVPFETSAEDRAIAENLADDIATALTRAGISVMQEPRFARYRMLGAIRGSDVHQRVVLQLIDQESGRQLWAHRNEGVPVGASESHEQLATRIVATLQPNLRWAEIERARTTPDTALGPHDLALRAMPGVVSLDAEGNARALDLLERALERDPDFPLAVALAAWAYGQRTVYHLTSDPAREKARGLALARQARSLPVDATVLAVLGNALTLLDELDDAALVVGKALAIDGGCAWAWSRSGWLEVYQGDAESAIERFKIALDLAPQDSLAFNSMVGIGCAHFEAGNYAEAARWQQRAVLEHPSSVWMHRTLCPAYLLTGARSQARRSLDALRSCHPELTLSDVRRGMPPLPESYRNLVLDALSDLGLPA
jgi:AraC-like DNA-binding protein/Tfp pilus assembly protein PilF